MTIPIYQIERFLVLTALSLSFPITHIYFFLADADVLRRLEFKPNRYFPLFVLILALIIHFWQRISSKTSSFLKQLPLSYLLPCVSIAASLLWILSVLLIHALIGNFEIEVYLFQATVVGKYIFFFFLGYISFWHIQKNSFFFTIFWLIMCLNVMLFLIFKPTIFHWLVGPIIKSGTYSFLAESFSIWSIVVLASKKDKSAIIAGLFSLLIIFWLQSRSAFIFFTLVLILYLFCYFTIYNLILVATALIITFTFVDYKRLSNYNRIVAQWSKSADDIAGWSTYSDDKNKSLIKNISVVNNRVIHLRPAQNDQNILFVYRYSSVLNHSTASSLSMKIKPFDDISIIFICSTIKGDRKFVFSRFPRQIQTQNEYSYDIDSFIEKNDDGWLIFKPNLPQLLTNQDNLNKITTVRATCIKGHTYVDDITYKDSSGQLHIVDNGHGSDISHLITKTRQKIKSILFHRTQIFDAQTKSLYENWLWGDFAGQTKIFEDMGYYIHNYLSLWRQFGLFPFIFLLYGFGLLYFFSLKSYISQTKLNLATIISCCKNIKFSSVITASQLIQVFFKKFTLKHDSEMLTVFLLATFNLGEAILARSYATPYIWFSAGLLISWNSINIMPSEQSKMNKAQCKK